MVIVSSCVIVQCRIKHRESFIVLLTCVFKRLYRDVQITGVRSRVRMNFVTWRLKFVGPPYGTCFVSSVWYSEIRGASSEGIQKEVAASSNTLLFIVHSVFFCCMSLVEKHSSDLRKAPTEQEGRLAVALHTVACKGKL